MVICKVKLVKYWGLYKYSNNQTNQSFSRNLGAWQRKMIDRSSFKINLIIFFIFVFTFFNFFCCFSSFRLCGSHCSFICWCWVIYLGDFCTRWVFVLWENIKLDEGGEVERDVKRGVSKPNDIHSANIDNDWESIEWLI